MKPEPEKKEMALDMRRTKLKAEEAALLLGELKKPSWQSKNEGIHERVSFEDSIWGFDLAGGAYYKTPLRVVGVKENSRAQKAGIRPGDKLTRINDIDTSTLTIQEAHEIIIESGIHLRLAVTAPEDEEDSYFCYEDPFETGYDSEEERRKEEERERKRRVHAKVSSYWSLQWPWVSKRRIIYRESNCFMVPSKYETKHSDRFSPLPMLKTEEDVVLDSTEAAKSKFEASQKARSKYQMQNGNQSDQDSYETETDSESNSHPVQNGQAANKNIPYEKPNTVESLQSDVDTHDEDSVIQNSVDEDSSILDDSHKNEQSNEAVTPSDLVATEDENEGEENEENSNSDHEIQTNEDENEGEENEENSSADDRMQTDEHDVTSPSEDMILSDDKIIDEITEDEGHVSKEEEEEILDSILSESEEKSVALESEDEQ